MPIRSLPLAGLITAVAAGAYAHDSLVHHAHPHGASALLGLDVLTATAIAAAALFLVAYGVQPARRVLARLLRKRPK